MILQIGFVGKHVDGENGNWDLDNERGGFDDWNDEREGVDCLWEKDRDFGIERGTWI